MESRHTLDEAVRIMKDRHRDRKQKRSRLSASSAQHSVREATALSTELQLMVAWGILHASAAAVLARKQKEDYELLGVAVPTEIGQNGSGWEVRGDHVTRST